MQQLSCGRDVSVTVCGAWRTRPAAWPSLLSRSIVADISANGRRKGVERNGLPTAVAARIVAAGLGAAALLVVAPWPTAAIAAALSSFRTILAFGPLSAFRTLLLPILSPTIVGGGVDILVAVLLLFQIIIALAARILLFEAGAALAQHAKIMVGELEVIFGLDPIASKLGIARHALVFFKQLRRIAALAVVLAIAGLAADVLAPLPAAAATAATLLSIIDQMPTSLRSVACPFASCRQGGGGKCRAAPDSFDPVCA
jgi:hypothetical protein